MRMNITSDHMNMYAFSPSRRAKLINCDQFTEFSHYLSTATTARILLVVSLEICRHEVNIICIGVGAQSTLGGTKFFPEKYVLKISKMPKFYMILARKKYKIPEFLYLSEKFTKFPNFK